MTRIPQQRRGKCGVAASTDRQQTPPGQFAAVLFIWATAEFGCNFYKSFWREVDLIAIKELSHPMDEKVLPPGNLFFSERSEEHTSELQSPYDLVCRLLLEK